MDKMRMESIDMTAQNIERIAALFPNCVTEAIDEEHSTPEQKVYKRAVNFELLKQMLSPDVIDGDEAYEFTWVGKKAAIVEANKPIRKTLRPVMVDETVPTGADGEGKPYCSSAGVNWDTTENLYIEGDNLEVLKLLQESYLGKVKMIYIDPPYNTGNDFIYRDDFAIKSEEWGVESGAIRAKSEVRSDESDEIRSQSEELSVESEESEDGTVRLFRNTDSNGRFHSDWCSMIYSRLMLARNLLSDDGVIFISIDYNENFNLRRMADEVFGESSFIGEIYWESKTKSQNTVTSFNKLQPKAEMILVYSMLPKKRFHLIQLGKRQYPMVDERGAYREHVLEVMNANGVRGRATMVFDISDGVSTVSLPEGKQWQLGQDQVATYKSRGDLIIRDGKVIIKMRPEYERNETTEPFWGLFSKELGTAESAKKELNALLGAHGFETVKPVEIIKRLCYHASDSDDIILDFFSGSATTAHAVMQLNAEDGGHRKFIMVQLPEPCDEKSEAYKAGYSNICEIGKERIRRAAKKIAEEHPDAKFDGGFRVLKLDDTNMKDVYYAPAEYDQSVLDLLESNIKEDRIDLDLLFGCLLEWGLPLSLPYQSETIEGCAVHNYNDGDLIACFDEDIPGSVIKTIARRKPLRAVFRDSSFKSSPAKINVTQIFKELSPDTSVKVL